MSKLSKHFEQLAAGRSSFSENRSALLSLLKPKAKNIIASRDWDATVDQFNAWLLRLIQMEPPPKTTQGLYFGLFESEAGFTLYVTGANEYDADDPDWACANDWWPDGRYATIPLFAELDFLLKGSGEKAWEVAQAIAILVVKEFFRTQAQKFQERSGLKQVYVATGFDDGDLYDLPTALMPTNV